MVLNYQKISKQQIQVFFFVDGYIKANCPIKILKKLIVNSGDVSQQEGSITTTVDKSVKNHAELSTEFNISFLLI